MKSIRFKLFLVFIVLLITFQGISLAMSNFFLEDVFIFNNKQTMIELYAKFIKRIEAGENERDVIYKLADTIGGDVTYIDTNRGLTCKTSPHHKKEIYTAMLDNIRDDVVGVDAYDIITTKSHDENKNIMILAGKIAPGEFFIIEKPLVSIYESSRIAERFILLSGIGTLIIGSIIVFFLSKRLTRTIINTNEVAQAIAHLNFNKRVENPGEDEIGVLGDSINLIADKLSGTLDELNESNTKLQEDIDRERSLEKMRRKFVSSVSHELKTPISMIQGYTDGLKFNIAKTQEDRDFYCDVIIEESNRMNYLVKDLLDLSSYESGVFKVVKESFNLTKVLEDTISKYSKKFNDVNVSLEMNLEDKCYIRADKIRIVQIITNFISNAQKNVIRGGVVRIDLKDDVDSVILSIYNTGANIPQKELKNIWTSFYKLNVGDGDTAGTGLGLAIVRAIVELHKGSYGVENQRDGVKLWVQIPKE